MPEGPEIRKAADKVAQALVGRTVVKLEFGQKHLKKWQSHFIGLKVKAIDTYGKAMVTRFESSNKECLNIYSHKSTLWTLGMLPCKSSTTVYSTTSHRYLYK